MKYNDKIMIPALMYIDVVLHNIIYILDEQSY